MYLSFPFTQDLMKLHTNSQLRFYKKIDSKLKKCCLNIKTDLISILEMQYFPIFQLVTKSLVTSSPV